MRRCAFRLTSARVLGTLGLLTGGGSLLAEAANAGPAPTEAQTLTPLSAVTYFPVLDLNPSGAFAAAWYRGAVVPPAPGAGAAARRDPRDEVVVSTGSVYNGFRASTVVGRSGSAIEGQIHVATTADGLTFVAWLPAGSSIRWLIAVGRGSSFAQPIQLNLARGGYLTALRESVSGTSVKAVAFVPSRGAEKPRLLCSDLSRFGRLRATRPVENSTGCGRMQPGRGQSSPELRPRRRRVIASPRVRSWHGAMPAGLLRYGKTPQGAATGRLVGCSARALSGPRDLDKGTGGHRGLTTETTTNGASLTTAASRPRPWKPE
jgi:hypothetical protein